MGVNLQIDVPSRGPSPIPPQIIKGREIALNLPKTLTLEEKKYLLAVERGDLANVRRMLQRAHRRHHININCVDSLGRGSLTIAIDSENLEMVELLVIMGVETKDALLQAINAEFVEAVELLLEHEELIHVENEPYSWQKVEMNTSMFTPDITPLVLAAHRNNYEILKILLDRGATIPMPHDIRCGCDDCIRLSSEDSLRHSLSRVNEYRALASPSLIALSSNDPLLTAFQLSWELRNLAFSEQECKTEYLDLRRQCQKFAVDLLDQSRSSQELAIILNYDPEAPPYEDGDHMKLARLELAINYKQKKFVAHPNIQQLLASMWYEGLPGFRRKHSMEKLFIILRVAILFPLHCLMYMIAPNAKHGVIMKKPFMKFLIHASSYLFFLLILILVSQRAEVHLIMLFGTQSIKDNLEEQLRRQRGNGPTHLELLIVLYVIGFVWEETQEIYLEGIKSYLRNMWNFIDFSRNFLYCCVMLLRTVAYIQQTREISRDPETVYIPRENWDDYDPQLIAEGLFAAANIFSALKLVHLFSINPHLGPLQISLGRMVIDIVKFCFIYSLVLFAFACGLNQLLWYFADLEKRKCYALPGGLPDWENTNDACMKWRRFGNLFESSQSLFWASFGMVGLESFELQGIKSYTRFWGLLMFGSYSVINVIVLLNLLIAMMSNSYAMIDSMSDTEWKFARTKLWMSYFEDGATLPPPFNVLPSVKWITRWFRKKKDDKLHRNSTKRRMEDRENRYTNVMRSLVWRYVSSMHRKDEESTVTEDDINEVKSDISAMRYEMLEIFERNGMDISTADKKEKAHLAKKMKVWERRLMKDFHVAPVNVDEEVEEKKEERGLARFKRVAKEVVSQTNTHKWGVAVKGVVDTQIGRCNSRESFKNQENLRKAIDEAKKLVSHSPLPRSSSCSPVEYSDPHSSTLLQLLKNISEEVDDLNPKDTATMATLNNTLQEIALSRSTSPSVQRGPMGNLITVKAKSTSPPKVNKEVVTKKSVSAEGLNSSGNGSELQNRVKNSELESSQPDQMMPLIQITLTESQEKKKFPTETLNTNISIQQDCESSSKLNKKRRPPSVPNDGDISISRPVAVKPSTNQGMIPPPPTSVQTSAEKSESLTSDNVTTPQYAIPPTSTIVSQPIILSAATLSTTKDNRTDPDSSGYSEPVTKSDIESNKQTSPSCLRPYRKVEDVTTVKRQPKSGWL
ncbi:hypothetical protein HA402_014315 [Bradysia odoriphaga]|nr:hypothetical protein HA402_014315 [Bradysia odoriphaga]